MGADAVLAVVKDRAPPERAFHVAPTGFDVHELLVGGGRVLRIQRFVAGAKQALAVQVRLDLDRMLVDTQQASAGAAQVAAQPGFGLSPDSRRSWGLSVA